MTPQAVVLGLDYFHANTGPKIDFFLKAKYSCNKPLIKCYIVNYLKFYMPTAGMQLKKTAKCFTSPCFVMLCDWHLVSQNHMFAYVNLCDLNFYTLCSFLINTLCMFPRVGEHTRITWLNCCIALQICILPRANNFDSNQLTKEWRTVECSLLKSFFIPVRTRKFWECIGIL